MTKKALYSLLTIALMGGFLFLSLPAHGVSILPVDTLMQQAYLRSQEEGFTSLTKSLSQGGNIYDSSYKLAKKNVLGGVTEAFSSVADNLNTQYSCSLTSADISTIVASDPQMNASLAGFAGRSTFAIDNQALVTSCVRVTQCVKGQAAGSVGKLTDMYTQETYPFCRNAVKQAYDNTISITVKKNALDTANHGDDIFYNGTLDDSPYDLLLDMQLIGDVLFKSNTAAPQVILYDFPGVGTAGSSFTFFNPTGNQDPNLAITNNGGNNLSPISPTNGNSTNSQTATQNQALQQLSAYHQSLNGSSNTSTQNGTSNGLVCVTPATNNTGLTPAQISANQTLEASNLEQALGNYNSAINPSQSLYNAMTSAEMQNNNSNLAAIAGLANGNGAQNQDPNSPANSCLSKCDTLAPADKAVCQAKCLCGTKYSNNGIFGISVCTVPTSQAEVIGGKTVKSVEEIVDELNTILTALRNSGQLIKHTKTKEFLDTSLSKIKLNQILSFDMNVAFKPLYDPNTNREQKEAKKSQETAIADMARQGTYMEENVGQERNKYIILSNPVKQQQQTTTLADNPSPAPATSITPTLPYDLAKTLNNDMLINISNFIDQNALLWEQVAETLNNVNTTTANLEKKIQRGK